MENFTFDKRDEFHRKGIAEKAIKLLRADIDISPMVIDGDWGTGKTEFCHKLINLFKHTESSDNDANKEVSNMLAENSTEQEVTHQLIYIDAFKADHADEPLLTIVSEILKNETDEKKKTKLIKKAIPVLRTAIKTVGKAAVSHILRQDTESIAEGYDEEIQKIADKAIDVTIETMLKDHVEAEKNLEALQSILKEIADKKPIVIFIDELDRCRPDFAINMLEVIKHTFDIDNVQFVLVTNMTQLEAAVNHCYGSAVDAKNYLDKFLKFRFELPKKVLHYTDDEYASIKYFKLLINESNILKDTLLNENDSGLNSIIGRCIMVHDLSLRTVKSLVTNIEIFNILHREIPKSSDHLSDARQLICFFDCLAICLLTLQPKIARDILDDKSDAVIIAQFLGEENIYSWEEDGSYPKHYQVLCVLLGRECKNRADLFTPTADDKEWNELIRAYLRGMPFYNDGDILKRFTKTLSQLSLNFGLI